MAGLSPDREGEGGGRGVEKRRFANEGGREGRRKWVMANGSRSPGGSSMVDWI